MPRKDLKNSKHEEDRAKFKQRRKKYLKEKKEKARTTRTKNQEIKKYQDKIKNAKNNIKIYEKSIDVRLAIEKQGERFSVYVGYQPQLKSSELNKYSSPMDTLPSGTSSLVNARNVSVRKQIRVRRKPCTGAELVGLVGAVLFSADDIELVYGAPGSRRRYLDILLSQSDSNYI